VKGHAGGHKKTASVTGGFGISPDRYFRSNRPLPPPMAADS
jgi:hypothetical protein